MIGVFQAITDDETTEPILSSESYRGICIESQIKRYALSSSSFNSTNNNLPFPERTTSWHCSKIRKMARGFASDPTVTDNTIFLMPVDSACSNAPFMATPSQTLMRSEVNLTKRKLFFCSVVILIFFFSSRKEVQLFGRRKSDNKN